MQALIDPRQAELLECLREVARESDHHLDPRHLRRMIELAESPIPALARDSFHPGHFTASAFVRSADGGSLLLILHEKLQMWLQPGGHIEPRDFDISKAAARELREETGLANFSLVAQVFDVDVHEIPPFPSAPAHLHHDVRALFQAESEEVAGSDDALSACWFPLDQLAFGEGPIARGYSTDESVRRVARRLLEGR